MLSAGGPGAACGLTTSWGLGSATGGTCSTLVKGRGPGSELDTSCQEVIVLELQL